MNSYAECISILNAEFIYIHKRRTFRNLQRNIDNPKQACKGESGESGKSGKSGKSGESGYSDDSDDSDESGGSGDSGDSSESV